jgi:hypothetical protein
MDAAEAQTLSTFKSQELTKSDRPALGDASKVVSGGMMNEWMHGSVDMK